MSRLLVIAVLLLSAGCTDGPVVLQCTTTRVEGLPDRDALDRVGEAVAVRARVYDECGAALRSDLTIVSSDITVIRVEHVSSEYWPDAFASFPRTRTIPLLRAAGAGGAWIEYRHPDLGVVALTQVTVVAAQE